MNIHLSVSNSEKLRGKSKTFKSKVDRFNKMNIDSPPVNKKDIEGKEGESIDMRYEDDIYQQQMLSNGMFNDNTFLRNREPGYAGLEGEHKRNYLTKVSNYSEITNILSKLANECIVIKNKKYCEIVVDENELLKLGYKEKFIKKINESLSESFNSVYKMLDFSKNKAWLKFFEYLVEGSLAYEIVYDDPNKPKKIVMMAEMDSLQLQEYYKEGTKYWLHKKDKTAGEQGNVIIMYDRQVVKIDWNETGKNQGFSYLDKIFREYNMYRIMEETQVIWTVMNSIMRVEHIMPAENMARTRAAQSLAVQQSKLMEDYDFRPETGEMFVDGKAGLPFQRAYFKANNGNGRPETNIIENNGQNMGDVDNLEYFLKKLREASEIPLSRYDSANSESWSLDPETKLMSELGFDSFVNRVMSVYDDLLLKPCLLQLYMDFPELMYDNNITDYIYINRNSNNHFTEMANIRLMGEKVRFVDEMYESLKFNDPEGIEHGFWSRKFLLNRYIPELSNEDIALNDKMRVEEEKQFVEEYNEIKDDYSIDEFDDEGDAPEPPKNNEKDTEDKESDNKEEQDNISIDL